MVAALAAAQIMLLGVCAGAQAKPAPAPAGGCPDALVTPANASMRPAASQAVLCLVNAERAQRGLPALRDSSLLDKAAGFHSTDMVRRKYFAHVAPNGLDPRRRVARTGYLRGCRSPAIGETIAFGTAVYGSPVELVKSLMESAPHRAIILDRRFREIGVGLALGAPMDGFGDFGSTLALNFGRR
jgi:uncharacterized protein YkwD